MAKTNLIQFYLFELKHPFVPFQMVEGPACLSIIICIRTRKINKHQKWTRYSVQYKMCNLKCILAIALK